MTPRRWTQREIDDMRTLRGEGWTWRAIAERLGRSHGATRVRAHLEGLTRPPRKQEPRG